MNLARLRRFIGDMTSLVGGAWQDKDEAAILEVGATLLGELVKHDDWLPESMAKCPPHGYAQNMLWCDPFERFCIVSFVWAPSAQTPVHDHQMWGLVGMLRGSETSQAYKRDEATGALTLGECSALKPGDGEAVDETSRHSPQSVIGAYKRSKLVAEREVERLIAQENLPAVIVAPSTPIGPRDIKPTPTGRIIVEAATGRMPAFVDTGLNLVHVEDVAEGHFLALEKGRIGQNYILGGEDVSLETMLGDIAAITGRKAPTIKLPRGPLFPLAYGAELLARLTGKEPFLTADALRMSRYRMFFSSAKAKAELGYTARPYQQGLKDALAWFGAHGYLR